MARQGRPPKHDDIIGQRPVIDPATKQPIPGRTEQITRTQQIVGDIRVGLNAERAAKRAGLSRETLHAWEQIACEVRARLANAPEGGTVDITDRESDLLSFSDALHAAELEWQTQMELVLQGAAQGGTEVVERLEVKKGDRIVETRTTTKTLPPDLATVRWRLKHRFPDQYSERVIVTGEGDDGAIPVEVRVGDKLRAWLQEQGDTADSTTE